MFSRELAWIGRGLSAAERVVTWLLGIGLILLVGHRLRDYLKSRLYREVPRVDVFQLRERLRSASGAPLICDARSHGYYEERAQRIPGSTRLEPSALEQVVKTLPRDREIYLYCT